MYKNSFNVSSSIHFTSKSYINILPSAELLPTTLLPNQLLDIYIYIQSNLSILSDVKLIQFSWARGNQTFLPIFLQNELHNMLKIYHGILTVPRTSTSLCSLPIMTCIGILYIHFSECILMLILCQNKTAADMKHCRKPLKPLSTLPEEIHISKFEDL